MIQEAKNKGDPLGENEVIGGTMTDGGDDTFHCIRNVYNVFEPLEYYLHIKIKCKKVNVNCSSLKKVHLQGNLEPEKYLCLSSFIPTLTPNLFGSHPYNAFSFSLNFGLVIENVTSLHNAEKKNWLKEKKKRKGRRRVAKLHLSKRREKQRPYCHRYNCSLWLLKRVLLLAQ